MDPYARIPYDDNGPPVNTYNRPMEEMNLAQEHLLPNDTDRKSHDTAHRTLLELAKE